MNSDQRLMFGNAVSDPGKHLEPDCRIDSVTSLESARAEFHRREAHRPGIDSRHEPVACRLILGDGSRPGKERGIVHHGRIASLPFDERPETTQSRSRVEQLGEPRRGFGGRSHT